MSKFIFESIITRSSTSVAWFEDHCIAVGQPEKSVNLNNFFSQHRAVLNVNSTFSNTETNLEKKTSVEFTESEYKTYNTNVDAIDISAVRTVIQEYFDYMKSNNIYYRMGSKEVDKNNIEYQLTLETSDDNLQDSWFAGWGGTA